MASSGTATFTVTRDTMVTAALRKLRVIDPEVGTPTTNMIATGVEAANIMLKHWAVHGLKLWCYQNIVVPMVVGKRIYTLGPSGADVTCVRPLRVFEYGNFLRDTSCACDGNGQGNFDIPLRLISRAEYRQFGYKFAQGIPNSIYYNPTIDTTVAIEGDDDNITSPGTGFGMLFVYVTSIDTNHAIYLNAQRPIYDLGATDDDATQEFDLPSEWFEAIKKGLAWRLADEYEVPEARIARLKMEADEALQLCTDWSAEEASTTFQPDFTGRMR